MEPQCVKQSYLSIQEWEWEAVHRGMAAKKKTEKPMAGDKEELACFKLGYPTASALEESRWEALKGTQWMEMQQQEMR